MEIFEKIGKKASETFNCAAEKTNKLASDTKLRIKINDCKSKINDLYTEIGKRVYEKFVLDGNADIKDDIADPLTRISALTDEIEQYEEQRLELNDMKQCIKCKNKIEKKAKFCSECGAQQPEEVVHEVEVCDGEDENIQYDDSMQNNSNCNNENVQEKAEAVAEDVSNSVDETINNNEQ